MTRQTRPGGRLLELVLLFCLILLSAALLTAAVAIPLLLLFWLGYWSILLVLILTNTSLLYYWFPPVMRFSWAMCAAIWNPFLKYYGYEAHTLRPILNEERKNDGDDH